MKYIYPVVFEQDNDIFNVSVPDLPGCFTYGDSLINAVEMARDAMSMWLCDAENKNEVVPQPTRYSDIPCEPNSFVNLIDVDTDEYRSENDNRAIKKTLSIPSWLNSRAEKAGINFSRLLEKALKRELGLE